MSVRLTISPLGFIRFGIQFVAVTVGRSSEACRQLFLGKLFKFVNNDEEKDEGRYFGLIDYRLVQVRLKFLKMLDR